MLERWAGNPDAAERFVTDAEQALREVDDALYLALALCERGHVELARGRRARDWLAQAQELAAPLRAGPQSELAQALARLQRASARRNRGLAADRGPTCGGLSQEPPPLAGGAVAQSRSGRALTGVRCDALAADGSRGRSCGEGTEPAISMTSGSV